MPTIINSIHKYRPRGSWQQRPVNQIQKLVVHHSAAEASDNPEQRLTQIMGWHLGNSPQWMGLSYHYVITKNGNIYQTNNHEDLTWHDGVNTNSLGILVDGYFHAPNNNQPTSQQLESLEFLLTKLATKHPEFPAGNNPLQDIVGHRDVGATACPGDILYPKLVEIKQRINHKINNPQIAKTKPQEAIPESQRVEPQIPDRKFENVDYQNAWNGKDYAWFAGSLLDRDDEVRRLKIEVEKLILENLDLKNQSKNENNQTVEKIVNQSQNVSQIQIMKEVDKEATFGFIKNHAPTIIGFLSVFGYNMTQDQILQSASIAAPFIALTASWFMEKLYKLNSKK